MADGVDEAAMAAHLAAGTTFEDFFAQAPLNPRLLITGTCAACGSRDRGPAHAQGEVPGQARRRAREGPADGEGAAGLTSGLQVVGGCG